MNTLFLIPARGGSKGIPDKNIRTIAGKPLINYAIDLARCFTSDEHICLSTDSEKIKNVAEANGLAVHFLRPEALSTDSSGSHEVMMHALDFYQLLGRNYDRLVLLQPTSPFRLKKQLTEALNALTNGVQQVVSVKESRHPLYVYYTDENGLLKRFLSSESYVRRQDMPKAYVYNGAIYVYNVNALKSKTLDQFDTTYPVVMDEISSLDIDLPEDLAWAEFLVTNGFFKTDY